MIKARNWVLCLVLVPFLTTPAEASQKEKIKWLAPTRTGSTGLLNLPLADTLRRGELAVGLHGIHFNRSPGDLDFTIFSATVTGGVHDRVELFFSWEAQRRVHADAVLVNKIAPGDALAPARLSTPEQALAFYNDTPFLDLGFGGGPGELHGGVKLNLFSEVRNDSFGLAFQPIWKLPLSSSRTRLLRGLSNGAAEAGYEFIASKNLPAGATVTGQSGFRFTSRSQDLKLQHRFDYGAGLELPLGSGQLRFVGELMGSVFFGPASDFANPGSPLDLYLGLRIFPSPWMAISTAYGSNFNSGHPATRTSGDQPPSESGWLVQISFQRRVNLPPTIRCFPQQTWIEAGEAVTIRVAISDPDDSQLSLTWRTDRGTILKQGTSAVFDSTGLEQGTYRVSAEVSDGGTSVTCASRVDVGARNSDTGN